MMPHHHFGHDHPLRERLNALYFRVFSPAVYNSIIVFSLLLLLLSFVDSSVLLTSWYHWLEGVFTFLFIAEVALRLAVMKANFWESSINVVEASMCFFCLVVFSLLSVARHTTRVEHNALIFLRYAAQIFRIAGILHGAGASGAAASSTHFDVFQAGGAHLRQIDRDGGTYHGEVL
jgi:hypothetical protein